MARNLFLLASICLAFSLRGEVGNAQQQPKPDSPIRVSPFGPKRLNELIEKGVDAKRAEQVNEPLDRYLEHLKDRYRIFAGNEVKNLLEENPADERVLLLKKERGRVAVMELVARLAEYRSARAPIVSVLQSSRRVGASLLALDPDSTTRMEILEHSLEVAKEIEDYAKTSLEQGTGTVAEVAQAKYERLTAAIEVEEFRAELRMQSDGTPP